MRIKFISTYLPTKCGVAEHTKQLVKSVKNFGIIPEIIEIKKPTSSNPFYFFNLAKDAAKGSSKRDIIHIQFHLSIFGKLFGILPGFHITIFLLWLKFLTNTKIIVTLHDSPSKKYSMKKGKKEKILFYYYKFIYIFLKAFADQFIVHSENGKKINIEDWKINKEKISVLPMGLPVDIMKLDKKMCKKKLGYPNKKILMILGYIRGSKNYNIVLEALKRLDKKVILLFVGRPQLKKDIITYKNILKKIEMLQLEKRVNLLGFVKEEKMPLLLNATDVGITLHSQGGGDFLSSTMAMQLAYQIPLLSTNISSFENIKEKEKCLETFREGDQEDLTKKINYLLYNRSKIKILKTKSKEYWEKNNWDEIGKRTKNLYLSLVNRNE